MNNIKKIIEILVTGVLLILIIGVVFPLVPPFRGYYHTRTVLTGSMGHAVPTGSLVVNQYTKDRDLKAGDIVTFQKPDAVTPIFITHRIISVDATGLLFRFQTKGDANSTPDLAKINQANIEGKVIVVIPYLGYLIELLKTPVVFAVLVFIPLCIFIFHELFDAWKIWKKMSLNPKVPILLIFFLLQLVSIKNVYATFNSSPAQIKNITLTTATDFGCKLELIRSFDKKYITFIIKGLSRFHFHHLSYQLTYDNGNTPFGVIGNNNLQDVESFSKDIQLGSCSTKDCVYQQDAKNFKIDVKLDGSDEKEIEINGEQN